MNGGRGLGNTLEGGKCPSGQKPRQTVLVTDKQASWKPGTSRRGCEVWPTRSLSSWKASRVALSPEKGPHRAVKNRFLEPDSYWLSCLQPHAVTALGGKVSCSCQEKAGRWGSLRSRDWLVSDLGKPCRGTSRLSAGSGQAAHVPVI